MYNGLKIKKLIELKGMLQKDVYKKAGMSKPTFDGLVNEGANPTARNLELVADVLQCPIDYFFDRNIELSNSAMSVNGNGNKIQTGEGDVYQPESTKKMPDLIQYLEKELEKKDQKIAELNQEIGCLRTTIKQFEKKLNNFSDGEELHNKKDVI